MDDNKRNEVTNNMLKLRMEISEGLAERNQVIDNIGYYKEFEFKGSGLAINDAYIVKVKDNEKAQDKPKSRDEEDQQEKVAYEIYDKENNLVATVYESGEIEFDEKFLEELEKMNKKYYDLLNLDEAEFELPRELDKDEMVLTNKELDEREEEKAKEEGGVEKKDEVQPEEGKKQEEVAQKKGIPPHNVLFLRADSNFKKDHPEVEDDLYFYRDNDGIVRAEYIDENGDSQPSNFFGESTTAIRQETIDMGNDGVPVEKTVPYQTMQTKNLNSVDKDIQDIRINVEFDQYGYMEISEARQGKNGMWSSHDIEMQGRDYNSYAMNKITSIETRRADPNKITEGYKAVERTSAADDGIELGEMFLMKHAEEIIEGFIEEGYNREEAIKIFDLMIGEEKLTEEQAKKEVNDNIKSKENSKKREESRNVEEKEMDEDDGAKGPWDNPRSRL